MTDPSAILLLVHIAAAAVAVGTSVSLPLWIDAAEREPAHLAFTLRRVRWLDRHVATPAYGVVALSGLAVVLSRGISLTQGWLVASIVIYLAIAIAGFALYRPVSRARLAAVDRGGPSDPDYVRARRRARRLDRWVVGGVLVILALMVLKPF